MPNAEPRPEIDRIFHALGDPSRRAILDALMLGPRSVSRLAEPLGITLTAVTQHLRILEQAVLVQTEKQGRVRSCRLQDAGFALLAEWLAMRRPSWEQKLDRLGELLQESSTPCASTKP